ncbi:hypothetical protein D3C71_1681980 [compost metagenome]
MIYPTLWVELLDSTAHDRFGQPMLVSKGRFKVCPVKLIFGEDRTTVRTDSSGSHGSAQETVSDVVVLARPAQKLDTGDVLQILGNRVVIREIHPRYTVLGRHDHNEVRCEGWV